MVHYYPNIYNFIDVLKDIHSEINTQIKMVGWKKTLKIVKKENCLWLKMIEYENKLLNRFEHLKTVTF